jgi:integrase
MGWLERRGSGYLVRWRDARGRKHQRYFADEDEARRFSASLSVGARAARARAGRHPTLGEYLLETLEAADDLRATTRYHYRSLARKHILPPLGELPLPDVRATDLRQLLRNLKERGFSASYRTTVHSILSRTFRLALAEGLITTNPLAAVPAPRAEPRAEVRPLEIREVESLADAILPRYRVPVLVMAYAGLRVGEVGALAMPSVNLLRGELRIRATVARAGGRLLISTTKTSAGRRTVPIPPFLCREIQKHIDAFGLAPDGRLFHTPGCNQHRDEYGLLHAGSMHKPFRSARDRVGLPWVTPHTLRHTYAALLIRTGTHPKVVQALMGHTNISVTLDIYGHLMPGLAEEAVGRLEDLRIERTVGPRTEAPNAEAADPNRPR